MIKNTFYLPVDGFFSSHSLDNVGKSSHSLIFDSNTIYRIENTYNYKCESQIMYVVEFLNEDSSEILVQSFDKKNSVELSLFKYKEEERELQLLSSIGIDFQPTETILDSNLFTDIASPVLVISSIDKKYTPKHSIYKSIITSSSLSSYVVKMKIYKENNNNNNNKIWLILGYEDGSLFIIDINENIQYNCIFPGTVSSILIYPNTFTSNNNNNNNNSFILIVGTIYGEIYECKLNNELKIIEYDNIYSKKSCILSLCCCNNQLYVGTFSEKLIILEYNMEEKENDKKVKKVNSLVYSYPIMSLKIVEDEMCIYITTLREFYILKLK